MTLRIVSLDLVSRQKESSVPTNTITDANNCMQDTCIIISEPTALTLDIFSTTTTCMGNNTDGTATVVANGGALGSIYTFLWSNNFNPLSISA